VEALVYNSPRLLLQHLQQARLAPEPPPLEKLPIPPSESIR
jgi:hypothetical protein